MINNFAKDSIKHNGCIRFAPYFDTNILDSYLKSNDNLYKELKSYYVNILKQIKLLAGELKITNSMELNVLFSYLLWYGFLSKDNKLVFDCENCICYKDIDGISIMTGKSKCVNNAEMLKDIQREMGYSSTTVQVYMPTKKDSHEKNDIPRLEHIKKIIRGLKLGNHLCTIISDDYNIYIYDPTNNWFCNILNTRFAKICNSDRYMFIKSGVHRSCDHKEFVEDLKSMNYKNKSKKIYDMQAKEISATTIDKCDNNIKLLDDFHASISPDIESINRLLKTPIK